MGRVTSCIIVALAIAVSACSGDSTGPGGNDNGGNAPLSASVDGVTFRAASTPGATVVTRAGGFLVVVGANQTMAIGFTIPEPTGPGTFSLAGPGGTSFGLYQEDIGQRTWMSHMPGGAGSLTITVLAANRIAGTFQFTAVAISNEAPAMRQITNGRFDISYGGSSSTGRAPAASSKRSTAG